VDDGMAVPLGKARRVREGNALTVVSWSRQVQACAEACDALAAEGIAVDLIDLRTLWPWDRDAVLDSCARTGRLLAPDEGAGEDVDSEMIGEDEGIDGAGASAEEAAMHTIDDE